MWIRRTNKDAWEIIKSRIFPLSYWISSLGITLTTLMRDGGIYSLANDSLSSSDDYRLWVFWFTVFFITIGYAIWCIIVLFDYIRLVFFERKAEQNEHELSTTLFDLNKFSVAERKFLQTINKNDINTQLAAAIVIKDFLTERNKTICGTKLSVFIPTYSDIVKNTEKSLTYLISAVHALQKYESDKYYNSNLIISVGSELLKDR